MLLLALQKLIEITIYFSTRRRENIITKKEEQNIRNLKQKPKLVDPISRKLLTNSSIHSEDWLKLLNDISISSPNENSKKVKARIFFMI